MCILWHYCLFDFIKASSSLFLIVIGFLFPKDFYFASIHIDEYKMVKPSIVGFGVLSWIYICGISTIAVYHLVTPLIPNTLTSFCIIGNFLNEHGFHSNLLLSLNSAYFSVRFLYAFIISMVYFFYRVTLLF